MTIARPARQGIAIMTSDSLRWSRSYLVESRAGGIDAIDESSDLPCDYCGRAGDWLDLHAWTPAVLLSGCIYLCAGCMAIDDDADLWGGAIQMALHRAGIKASGGFKPFPVYVSVCPPATREDNVRLRWIRSL